MYSFASTSVLTNLVNINDHNFTNSDQLLHFSHINTKLHFTLSQKVEACHKKQELFSLGLTLSKFNFPL